jgi:5'-nucleotidase
MLARRLAIWAVIAASAVAAPVSASSGPMKVLVTNDDGYKAPGINALVNKLVTNPNLDVVVIAPAVNSSGTGESTTSSTIGVFAGTTASNYPATVVQGFPADTAIFGIRSALAGDPPALVVSGINFGQNVSGEIIPLSGTLGAATWAARNGVPAIAVSAGLGASPNYADAANYTAALVELIRTNKGIYKKLFEKQAPTRGLIVNVNFPTCTSGAVRGVVLVPVGRLNTITGYTLQGTSMGVDTWKANVTSLPFASNCTSTLTDPATDVEAFGAGFATVTILDPERNPSGRLLKQFKKFTRLTY